MAFLGQKSTESAKQQSLHYVSNERAMDFCEFKKSDDYVMTGNTCSSADSELH